MPPAATENPENLTSAVPETLAAAPAAAGLTGMVLKGSIWTLAGQALPLAVAFVTTPITIRLLGSESYGVLILVGLIPTYCAFADLGMGVASTRFGAAAFAEGKPETERGVVWTAASIAFIASLAAAVPIVVFSDEIIRALSVPPELQREGTLALRIASAAFVLNLLANVFNTPQLARLRMDLNSLIGGTNKVLMSLSTPVVIYLGGGIAGAMAAALVIAALTLAAHIAISERLLPGLLRPSLDGRLVRPLLNFGAGLLVSGIASVFLANFEKLSLPRLVSVESLAFYSVAFTFANIATMYSIAMVQSLIPAFSRLLGPERRAEFQALFSRSLRLNLIILLPAVMIMFVVARPFFTLWAGPDFGRESTLPFHILLLGLLFNLVAYVPHSAITASGRTDVFAKLYWIETILYVGAVILLVGRFGIAGAAAAWSLRVIIDAFLIVWLARKVTGVSLGLRRIVLGSAAGLLILLPPVLVVILFDTCSAGLYVLAAVCLCIYTLVAWNFALTDEEKLHLARLINSVALRYKLRH